jgi:alanine racemase
MTMISQPTSSWIELSRSALMHNIAFLKQRAGSSVAYMAVVKSNAYGHGMLEIAHLCDTHPMVTALITVSLAEAVALRTAGVTKRIIVMGYLDTDLTTLIDHNIEVSVPNVQTLQILESLSHSSAHPLPIHIKIDTGFTRFGFMPDEVVPLMVDLYRQQHLNVQGICTHFAESGVHDWLFTAQQRKRFFTVVQQLDQQQILPPLYHADKTLTALRPSTLYGNGMRIGAGLYGLLDSDSGLQQVMTWKSTIVQLRSVPCDNSISYGRTFYTQQESKIAVVPVGYYDGYDRRLSNKGHILVYYRTKDGIHAVGEAPVVGLVTMNALFLDVTHLEGVAVGDEVILLGDYPGLRAWDIAQCTGAGNPREVTLSVHPWIERRIVE